MNKIRTTKPIIEAEAQRLLAQGMNFANPAVTTAIKSELAMVCCLATTSNNIEAGYVRTLVDAKTDDFAQLFVGPGEKQTRLMRAELRLNIVTDVFGKNGVGSLLSTKTVRDIVDKLFDKLK